MLHVPETHVPRSRFPNIDFHTHLSWINRKGQTDVVRHNATIEETLRVMDAKNIRIMVNLTGGYGAGARRNSAPLAPTSSRSLYRLHRAVVRKDQGGELFALSGGTARSCEKDWRARFEDPQDPRSLSA
jgi:hypothetical protein